MDMRADMTVNHYEPTLPRLDYDQQDKYLARNEDYG